MSASTTATEIDLQGVKGNAASAAVGIEFGTQLMQFADSLAHRTPDLATHRQALLDAAGPTVLVDAAGVAANFQRMVRIADATGIPVDDMETELGQGVRRELELSQFPSAVNTLAV